MEQRYVKGFREVERSSLDIPLLHNYHIGAGINVKNTYYPLNLTRIQKGYMLSFNFNKQKEIGVKEIVLGNKLIIEAVV